MRRSTSLFLTTIFLIGCQTTGKPPRPPEWPEEAREQLAHLVLLQRAQEACWLENKECYWIYLQPVGDQKRKINFPAQMTLRALIEAIKMDLRYKDGIEAFRGD